MPKQKDYSEQLPEAVAAKYRCATMPGVYVTKAPQRVKVDLRKISVAQADELVKAGKLPQLVARPPKAKTEGGPKEGGGPPH